jgi:galactonate dehydratase
LSITGSTCIAWGKHFDAPVWQLLGGKVRDKIRLHLLMGSRLPDASDQGTDADGLRINARAAAEEGFTAIKTAIKTDPLPDSFHSMTQSRLIRETRDNVAAMREGAGEDVDLILEIHRKLTPMIAISLAEALVEFSVLFYEDPIQIDSITSQGDIAKRTSIPVANGERMHSIWEFRELLENGGPQYVRPDLGLAGGITQVKKIAAIAESYHSAVATHNYLGPVLTAASVQVDASIPNFLTQEYTKRDEDAVHAVYRNSLRREGGYIPVPDAPGIGVELDESKIASSPFISKELRIVPIRTDGSVGYSV